MNAQEYLAEKLQQLSNKFDVTFTCRLELHSGMYIIGVNPAKIYGNEEYGTSEFDITMAFDRLFTPESLLFVSCDDVLAKSGVTEFTISSNTKKNSRKKTAIIVPVSQQKKSNASRVI
jgi:hypothetical protein